MHQKELIVCRSESDVSSTRDEHCYSLKYAYEIIHTATSSHQHVFIAANARPPHKYVRESTRNHFIHTQFKHNGSRVLWSSSTQQTQSRFNNSHACNKICCNFKQIHMHIRHIYGLCFMVYGWNSYSCVVLSVSIPAVAAIRVLSTRIRYCSRFVRRNWRRRRWTTKSVLLLNLSADSTPFSRLSSHVKKLCLAWFASENFISNNIFHCECWLWLQIRTSRRHHTYRHRHIPNDGKAVGRQCSRELIVSWFKFGI